MKKIKLSPNHIKYGKWSFDYNPKPIPDRRWDYDCMHDEFDGENGDYFFNASSIDAAIKEADERETYLGDF